MKTKLILSFAALSSLPVTAANRSWDGGDATASMTAAANWDGNTAINPAVDQLFFPFGLALADRTVNNNYAANTRFHRMQFNDSYTLGGTIMELDESLICFHNTGTTVTVNAGLSLQNTVELNTSVGNLDFGAGSQIYSPVSQRQRHCGRSAVGGRAGQCLWRWHGALCRREDVHGAAHHRR